MVLGKECAQAVEERYWLEEDKKEEKDCQRKGHFKWSFCA